MNKIPWSKHTKNKIASQEDWNSDDSGLKSPVVPITFQTKPAASIVARLDL